MYVPLFEQRSDEIIRTIRAELAYPAFESSMGDTLVREVDDDQDDDPDALWLRAVRLQVMLDRIGGLS